jgi:hypothetical protein
MLDSIGWYFGLYWLRINSVGEILPKYSKKSINIPW